MRNQGLVLAAVLAMGLVACGDDEAARNADRDRNDAAEEADADDEDADETGADVEASADADSEGDGEEAPAAANALIDSDALALLMVFDDHVVEAAKLVQARGAAVQVKDLAKALDATRAADRGKAARLEPGAGPVTDHDEVQALKDTLAAQRATIAEAVDGPKVDVAFLDSMITSHTEALALIDDRLLPGARMDPVREHLGTARTAIAADLDKAQALLSAY